MPRYGRLHIPYGYYHVMGRGLERLGVGLEETVCQCHAFAVMSNHYHLLIQVSDEPLSQLMSKILSGYATYYNKRHKRSGYVFQNRYKSKLGHYRWTGHAGLMGRHVQHWQNRKEVLNLFSRQQKVAQKRYQEFIKDGLQKKEVIDLSG